MNQPSLFAKSFDITANRHRGNAQSVDANPTDAHKKLSQAEILGLILMAGRYGITSGEIEAKTGLAKNRFSGRITELASEDKILSFVAERRKGCAVWIARQFMEVAR